jgi:aminoglycoside phosphotransferase (APT) family kinase protein
VATGQTRADAALSEGLARWVAANPELLPGDRVDRTDAVMTSMTRADGGMANETLLLELNGRPGIVVRLPPLESTFPGYNLSPQAAVQNAVAAAGVPAPSPALIVDDQQWIGTPFLVMPRVEGQIPGPAPLFDEWLTGLDSSAQAKVYDGLLQALAQVHGVDWSAAELGSVLPRRTLGETLTYWTGYVEWAGEGEPLPALTTALDWCSRFLPADLAGAQVLLWGDPRLGNLVFDAGLAVNAVLDWDLASIGPPEMDLGWVFGLEFMMEQLFHARPVGFPTREAALERYVELSGRTVTSLGWHEVFALTRALAINDRHQRIAGSRRRRENPMSEILLARLAAAERDG